ncbi:MAG TPA: 3-hydroxyacyl-CoA dehydrogenase NAD-binding domain-containing protein, partial [Arthrobacter sp.]|nr:3-hydroxyacyl-CoA dehydrogenase NAD-binding domain-containing protein [Arthrobacter sp.]
MTYTLPANIADRPITVVGGGTRGRRIALMLSLQGAEVRVFDTSLAVARAALEYVATQRHRTVEELG